MPRKAKATKEPVARSLEAQLWDAANGMRGSVPPSDYMHVALGLVFLRYLSVAFESMKMTLCETPHADSEDRDEYQFWVPPEARWKFGIPPVGNANFAWLQHIYHHLTPDGFGGTVLANGSMSSNSGVEGEIRKAMIEGDAVDCMVALPNQLFFGTQIPVCLWILARNKGGGENGSRTLRNRKGEILFLDARKLGHMVSRVQRELSTEDIQKIAGTYHTWREGNAYADVAGFCKSASLEEIRAHGHVLTPGRYVGAEDIEDDGEPFEEKMPRLGAELNAQFAESAKLETPIRNNLQGLGFSARQM
jgi:type I restriction enzyme M protein